MYIKYIFSNNDYLFSPNFAINNSSLNNLKQYLENTIPNVNDIFISALFDVYDNCIEIQWLIDPDNNQFIIDEISKVLNANIPNFNTWNNNNKIYRSCYGIHNWEWEIQLWFRPYQGMLYDNKVK